MRYKPNEKNETIFYLFLFIYLLNMLILKTTLSISYHTLHRIIYQRKIYKQEI